MPLNNLHLLPVNQVRLKTYLWFLKHGLFPKMKTLCSKCFLENETLWRFFNPPGKFCFYWQYVTMETTTQLCSNNTLRLDGVIMVSTCNAIP